MGNKKNKKYNINNSKMDIEELMSYYRKAVESLKKLNEYKELECIFFAAKNNKRFPDYMFSGEKNEELYIEKWVKRYYNSMEKEKMPSSHKAKSKTTCFDPAIQLLFEEKNIDKDKFKHFDKIHYLYESAENVLGGLLEEYIAGKVKQYGFLWCKGDICEATDFCSKDGKILLQIKNKENTENSSSSKARKGTGIIKWYRLGNDGSSDEQWKKLNEIINDNKTENVDEPCQMCEKDYLDFIKGVVNNNPEIILEYDG